MLKQIIPEKVRYTLNHKHAYLQVERQLLGRNTIRGYLHDLDKVVLLFFLPKETVHKLHRSYSRHHLNKARTRNDFIDMIIDWECARITKPDKPLNAYNTLYKFYPEKEENILPLLRELKLIT